MEDNQKALLEAFNAYQKMELPPEIDEIDISELKIMLGYFNSSLRDNVLKVLKKRARQHMMLVLGSQVTVFPMELDYIADELTASRMTQLNSEGLKTESTDITRYDYVEDINAKWLPYINSWKKDSGLNLGRSFRMA